MDQQELLVGMGLPQSEAAEMAVLGSILLEPGLLYEISQVIKVGDFYRDSHKKIYAAILSLHEGDKDIDIVTLSNTLKIEGILDAIGGTTYLTELYDAVPSAANAVTYAHIVKDKASKRQLIAVSQRISQEAQTEEKAAALLLDEAEAEVYRLKQQTEPTSLKQVGEFVAEAYDRIGKEEKGIPTFIELDKLIGGLKKGEMIIVAARPGMGKTTICLNIAERAATLHEATVAFFTLEMTAVQVASRMLFARARVNQEEAKSAKGISDGDFAKLAAAMEEISRSNLYIDDTSMIAVAELRSKLRKLKREKGLDLVVVDYIGLMQASSLQQTESRQQQISEISRQLKGLAKEMEIPVVVISQLNRASVKNEGKIKEPDLSHLRESGALEQDADIVIFIHRPHYYDESENKHLAKAIVAKNRNGAVGTAQLGFLREYSLFCDMDFHHEEENRPPDEEKQG